MEKNPLGKHLSSRWAFPPSFCWKTEGLILLYTHLDIRSGRGVLEHPLCVRGGSSRAKSMWKTAFPAGVRVLELDEPPGAQPAMEIKLPRQNKCLWKDVGSRR